MEKVITIHLGHTAFLIDEPSYEALKKYLEDAKIQLQEDPDSSEIMNDIECAIAEKLLELIQSESDVVQLENMSMVLEQMGPVKSPEQADDSDKNEDNNNKDEYSRRLYQIPNGAILTGVCNGLGAYLKVDVLLVRIVFIILTLITSGFGIFLYALLALVVPYADTSEKESKAHGKPFNAQTLVEQAKENYERLTNDTKMHNRWNESVQRVRDNIVDFFDVPTSQMPRSGRLRVNNLTATFFSPILGVLSALLFLALLYSIFTLTTQNEIFNYAIPSTLPLWAAIIGVVMLYLVVYTPISSLKTSISIYNPRASALSGFMEAVVILGVGFFFYQYVPEAREFMQQIPEIIESTVKAIKESKGK